MTEKAQYTGRLAPVKGWLGSVTEKDLFKGAVIVSVTAILTAATSYTLASRRQVAIPAAGSALQTVSAIIAIIATLLGWILSTAIYHAASRLLGGKGSLNRMFALSGYASLPFLVQELLRFILYVLLNQSATTATMGLIDFIFTYFNFFSVIALVLTGVAVVINYGLSGRKAAVVALLPKILIIVLALVTTFVARGATQVSGNRGLFGLRSGLGG